MPKVRIYPDSILQEKAKEVKDFSKIHHLVEKMLKAMVDEEGIGLAANQIGVASQVLVGRSDEEKGPIILVNPIIVKAEGEDKMDEGCLSVPEVTVEIPRAESLLVRGFDAEGEEVEYKVEGLTARMIQHEIDHLNGILIIDYLSGGDFLKFQMEYGKKDKEK
jgi:peptide deformylase